ncbi:MAG: hypothetical protein NTX64_17700 [Elusimicrobia bacterium]|nr:hypothetical protein [Elusimicrobiota bacterium]
MELAEEPARLPKLKAAPMKESFSSLLFLLLSSWTTAQAGVFGPPDCAGVAGELAHAAVKGHRRHVAVIPFRDTAGSSSRDGTIIAERLVAHLLENGSFDVVERTQLAAVVDELRLGATGGVDPAMAQRLGRFLGVEAIVTGSVVELVGHVTELHARLIDVETAKVLAASTGRVEKDWSDFEAAAIFAVAAPPMPMFPGERRRIDWRDGLRAVMTFPAAPVCDTLDDRVVEFSNGALLLNPGSEIKDPGLRERFYSRLRVWYDEENVPPLSENDKTLLASCD